MTPFLLAVSNTQNEPELGSSVATASSTATANNDDASVVVLDTSIWSDDVITVITPAQATTSTPLPATRRRSKRKRACGTRMPLHLCCCDRVCQYPEQLKDEGENSVQRDCCEFWFHWMCMDFDKDVSSACIAPNV